MPAVPCDRVEEYHSTFPHQTWEDEESGCNAHIQAVLSPCESYIACLTRQKLAIVDASAPGKSLFEVKFCEADSRLEFASACTWILGPNRELWLFVTHRNSHVSIYCARQRSTVLRSHSEAPSDQHRIFANSSCDSSIRVHLAAIVTIRASMWGVPLGFASSLERSNSVHIRHRIGVPQQHQFAVVVTSRGFLLVLSTEGRAVAKFRLQEQPLSDHTFCCACLCTLTQVPSSSLKKIKLVGVAALSSDAGRASERQLSAFCAESQLVGQAAVGSSESDRPWIDVNKLSLGVAVFDTDKLAINVERGVIAIARQRPSYGASPAVELYRIGALVNSNVFPASTRAACVDSSSTTHEVNTEHRGHQGDLSRTTPYAVLLASDLFRTETATTMSPALSQHAADIAEVTQNYATTTLDVTQMHWSGDGNALAVNFGVHGVAIWDAFGALVMNLVSSQIQSSISKTPASSTCWGPASATLVVWSLHTRHAARGSPPVKESRGSTFAKVFFLRRQGVAQQSCSRRGALPTLLGVDHLRVLAGIVDCPQEFEWRRIACCDTATAKSFFHKSVMRRMSQASTGAVGSDCTIRFCATTATSSVIAVVLQSSRCQLIRTADNSHRMPIEKTSKSAHLDRLRVTDPAFEWTPAALRSWNKQFGRRLRAMFVAWSLVPIVHARRGKGNKMSGPQFCLALCVAHCQNSGTKAKFLLSVYYVHHVSNGDEDQVQLSKNGQMTSRVEHTTVRHDVPATVHSATAPHLEQVSIELDDEPTSMHAEGAFIVISSKPSIAVLRTEVSVSPKKHSSAAENGNTAVDVHASLEVHTKQQVVTQLLCRTYPNDDSEDVQNVGKLFAAPAMWQQCLPALLPPISTKINPGATFLYFREFSSLGSVLSAQVAVSPQLWWCHITNPTMWIRVRDSALTETLNFQDSWMLPSASALGRLGGCVAYLDNTSALSTEPRTSQGPLQQRIQFQWPQLSSATSVPDALHHSTGIAWSPMWHCAGFLAGVVALVGVRAVLVHHQPASTRNLKNVESQVRPQPQWRLRSTLQPCLHALLAALIGEGHVAAARAMAQRAFRSGAPTLSYCLEKLLYLAVDVSARRRTTLRKQLPTQAAQPSRGFLGDVLSVIRCAHMSSNAVTRDALRAPPLSFLFVRTLVTCARKLDPAEHWAVLFDPSFDNPTPMHAFRWCIDNQHFQQAVLCANLLLHCVANTTFVKAGVEPVTYEYTMSEYYADLLMLFEKCLAEGVDQVKASNATVSSVLLSCLPYAARHLTAENLFVAVAGSSTATLASANARRNFYMTMAEYASSFLKHERSRSHESCWVSAFVQQVLATANGLHADSKFFCDTATIFNLSLQTPTPIHTNTRLDSGGGEVYAILTTPSIVESAFKMATRLRGLALPSSEASALVDVFGRCLYFLGFPVWATAVWLLFDDRDSIRKWMYGRSCCIAYEGSQDPPARNIDASNRSGKVPFHVVHARSVLHNIHTVAVQLMSEQSVTGDVAQSMKLCEEVLRSFLFQSF